MTYNFPGVCRRGGCGKPVSQRRAMCEGDIGWCDEDRDRVIEERTRATVGVGPKSGGRPPTVNDGRSQ